MQERLRNMRLDTQTEIRILLVDSNCWPVVPRLAMRFQKLGAAVAVLCTTSDHPVQSLREPVQMFSYSGVQPLSSLRSAIETVRPEIVVPTCDRSVQHLHELHAITQAEGGTGRSISRLIERSLGSPRSFPVVSSRHALLRIARQEEVQVPPFSAIEEASDLDRLGAHIPLPWVIKADGTWGGRGVRVGHSLQQAKMRFHELTDKPGALELLKRMALNRERDWVFQDWSRRRRTVIAQKLISGRPANCAVACHEGELLAGLAVEVIQSDGTTGPATIVQLVPGDTMLQAAARIARRLRLSGFFGLDFVIEESTGATYLIEMNPRCTPPCPLPLGEGRDLVAALWFQLQELPLPHAGSITGKSRIAYFPQSAIGSLHVPDSLLSSSFVDIPEEEPALVRHLLNPKSSRSLLGQIVDRLRVRLNRQPSSPAAFFESAMPTPIAAATDVDESALPVAQN